MKNVLDFLSNLLNSSVSEDETIVLTSAQRARFLSWSDRNGYRVDTQKLRIEFTVKELLSTAINQSDPGLNHYPEKPRVSPQRQSSLRVGIDIQSISEMFPASIELDFSDLSSIFTSYELKFSKSSINPRATLAGIFSLKECLVKAGAPHVNYLDLEITHTLEGSPLFYGFSVSLSHSGDFVTSIAIRN